MNKTRKTLLDYIQKLGMPCMLALLLSCSIPWELQGANVPGGPDKKPEGEKDDGSNNKGGKSDGDPESTNDDDDGDGCGGSETAGGGSGKGSSIELDIPFPILPHESGVGPQAFAFLREDPSPALFSPQTLEYNSVLSSRVVGINIGVDAPSGLTARFELILPSGSRVPFEVKPGESVGFPSAENVSETMRLTMLDANDNAVTDNPQFLLLEKGDSSQIKYPVQLSATPVLFRSNTGRLINFAGLPNAGVEVIREGLILRQVAGPNGLADIVVLDDYSYEIRFYTLFNKGSKNAQGLYQPLNIPYRIFKIENPTQNDNQVDKLRLTQTSLGQIGGLSTGVGPGGGRQDIFDFEFIPAADDWSLTKGNGALRKQITATTDPSTGDETKTYDLRDENGDLVSRRNVLIRQFPWNKVAVQRVMDPDGSALTTDFEYYEDSSETGRYAQIKQITYPDRAWVRKDYDTQGRLIQEVLPWQDSPVSSTANQAVEVLYDYQPVDGRDQLANFDDRPRVIIRKALGIEVARTYWAFFTDSATGEYVRIREKSTVKGAPYQDPSNLKTEWRYYASGDTDARSGRLKSLTRPDGTVERHDYIRDAVQNDFIETIDNMALVGGQAQAIPFKSTRHVMTYDAAGNLIFEDRKIYDGSGWNSFSTAEHAYNGWLNIDGRRQGIFYSIEDGRYKLFQTWVGGLVTSQVGEDGVGLSFLYDELMRVETIRKHGVDGRPDVYTLIDRNLGAFACGCDSEKTTTRTAGGLSLVSQEKTDGAGRMSEIIDEDGYSTTFAYVDDQRVVTRTNPDTSTQITEKYLDGRLKSETGSAIVNRFTTYGVNADGTQFTEVRVSSPTSQRYRRTTFDLAGRIVKEESPAFGGGTLTKTFSYNSLGLLEKQTEPELADTLFEYDALGNIVRSGLDIDVNGSLDLASSDRITDTDTVFTLEGGDWFRVTETKVYPDAGNATAVTVSQSKQRMNFYGIGDPALGALTSELITIDVNGNETSNKTYFHQSEKTITQILDAPDSDIDVVSKSVNGLLLERNTSTVAAPITFDYDALERRISIKDPRHVNASTFSYLAGTSLMDSQSDAAGNSTSFAYYGNGEVGAPQLKEQTDALGQKTYFEYNLRGQQVRGWGETDYPVEFGFDSFEQLTTLTTYRDAAGSFDFSQSTWPGATGGDTTSFIFDTATGLQTRKNYADGQGTDYTYTSAGRLATRTWARGAVTSYGYDAATGELLSTDYDDATADLSFTYDRLGRQVSVTDALGSRNFTYLSTNLQLDTEQTAGIYNKTLTRSYEGAGVSLLPGRNAGFQIGTDYTVTYGYDNVGRFNAVVDANSNFSYTYVNDSDLIQSINSAVSSVTYSYENNRNVRTVVENVANANVVSRYTYEYDAIGRRENRIQEGSAFAQSSYDDFGYNSRSEVIGSDRFLGTDVNNTTSPVGGHDFDFDFDAIGNRLSANIGSSVLKGATGTQSYNANELNQYTNVNSDNLQYDADGNLLSDGTRAFTWNGENRLIQIESIIPQAGDKKLQFVYDFRGRRVQKTVLELQSGVYVEILKEKYVYDDWNLILVLDALNSDTVAKTHTWGLDLSQSLQGAGGVGGLLSANFVGTGVHHYHYDANGNVGQLSDGAGVVTAAYEYSPFGRLTSQSGTLADDNTFRFSTKYTDTNSDLVYYGFRYYNAEMGRWMKRDPLGEQGHERSLKVFHNSFYANELRAEIFMLNAGIINHVNQFIGFKVRDIEDYYSVQDAIAEISSMIAELLFYENEASIGLFRAELLTEGASLYAFLGNSAISGWDMLGEAKGGKQNVKTTGGGNSIADQKASGSRHSSQSKDKPTPPKPPSNSGKNSSTSSGKGTSGGSGTGFSKPGRNPGASGRMGPPSSGFGQFGPTNFNRAGGIGSFRGGGLGSLNRFACRPMMIR